MRKKFDSFWQEYARNIKYGLIQDTANKNALAEVVKFHTTSNNSTTWVSFDEYISRMKSQQKDIYYIGGESIKVLNESPLLKGVVAKGYEVFMLTDPIDEYCVQNLGKYADHNLVNIAKSGFELPTEEDEKVKLKKL